MIDEENKLDGICTEIRCRYGRKPKASWINVWSGQWVCYPCAQAMNTEAVQWKMKPPCISSRDHMLNLLKT